MAYWTNWSGSVRAQPAQFAQPKTLDDLQALVRGAAKVRVVGAGHSFTPLCETDGLLLNLSELEGELVIAPDRKTVTAPAGWSLKRLTKAMWDEGLSLPNQGDVNPQSLAGAIGTGTHGTGRDLGSLSTLVQGVQAVMADGTVAETSRAQNADLFEGQRLSLGLFGVITAATIDVLPAYRLEERVEKKPMAWVYENFDDLAQRHRHAEFFVFPYADEAIVKTLHPIEAEDTPRGQPSNEEDIFRFCCDMTKAFPFLAGPIQRFMTRSSGDVHKVGPAYRIFPSTRNVRFEEMEYELPREAGLPALKEVIAWIRKGRRPVAFPFEFRWAAADDIWISPFNKGPGASISMHQYAKMPWQEVFAAAEPIFRSHGGRPHWGKRHFLTRDEVDALYPMAGRFREVRRKADPQGKFLNPHLADLFS
ncbi:MAG: D-arabinono-1,4-lactone oxidase [Phenylobacterium sp.]|jgi:FAD-linked oxidoreductase|nr:FAD-binding protein [Phenylobacterium sp.]MDZ4320612.1 D-arabinono-1,4-lactone oxidase [Phenylobacterium sp.]